MTRDITLKLLDSCDEHYAVFYQETLEGTIPVCGRDCQITIRHRDDGSKEISWDFLDQAPGEEKITIPSRLLRDLMDAADAVAEDIGGARGKWLERSTRAIKEDLGLGPDPFEEADS